MPSSRTDTSPRASSLATSLHRAAQTILPRRSRRRRHDEPSSTPAKPASPPPAHPLPALRLGHRLVTHVVNVCGQLASDGLAIRRASSALHPSAFSPFLLLDHCGPHRIAEAAAVGGEAPRCGQQALTYVVSGQVEYHDSCGNNATLNTGNVNLLTAGSGLVVSHSIRGPVIEYFSIWINIPKELRAAPPQHCMSEHPPFVITGSGQSAARISVLAGPTRRSSISPLDDQTKGEHASIELETAAGSAAVYDIKMQRKSQLVLNPETERVFVYVYRGAAVISKTTRVKEGDLAVLESDRNLPVVIDSVGVHEDTQEKPGYDFGDFDTFEEHACWCLVLAGDPVKEPVSMLSSGIVGGSPQEIREAFLEYTCGSMGTASPPKLSPMQTRTKLMMYDSDSDDEYGDSPSSTSIESDPTGDDVGFPNLGFGKLDS